MCNLITRVVQDPLTSGCRFMWEIHVIPANMEHSPNTVSMLVHRLRRWPNIEAELLRVCWDVGIDIICPASYPHLHTLYEPVYLRLVFTWPTLYD